LNASILAIGDEIVAGLTTDTNSGYLAQLLRSAGVDIAGFHSVADDERAIIRALRRALEDADLAITTGGLGPTADDLTTECVARLAGVPLVLHQASLDRIVERFEQLGLEMPANNRKQAMLPEGAKVVDPVGTAPGVIVALAGDLAGKHVITLPGVPREMRAMAEESVLPWLAERAGGLLIATRVYSTAGLSESKLDELLVGAIEPLEGRLSFRAAFPRMQARVTVMGRSAEEVDSRLAAADSRIRERLGDHLYAVGDEGLEETVGRLLGESGATIAVAESCTGGLIGHRLTDVPGSSVYYLLGIVAYSNEMKRSLLGVSERTLEEHGAVSEPTVREMARGVRTAAGASIGLATSGIAGPGGGTADKPVGTVCIGLAWNGGEWSRRYQLGGRSRSWVKEVTAQIGLDRLRRFLLEEGKSLEEVRGKR
jgi:nicotinamide-nucleotide amidase